MIFLPTLLSALILSARAAPTMYGSESSHEVAQPASYEAATMPEPAAEMPAEASMGHESMPAAEMPASHEMPAEMPAHEMPAEAVASTSVEAPPAETPMYGSGSTPASYGQSGYADCVAQCSASWPAPTPSAGMTEAPAATPTDAATPPAAETPAAGGATHTVIVAPKQGVLRYVPFAVNATIGDTIFFKWQANNHTVTQGSALTPCNKSSDATAFTPSGIQQKDFTFTQVVNTTEPLFYYCAAPNHCEKGMFGIINPPNAESGSATSAGTMMKAMTTANEDMAAMASYTAKQTSGNTFAASWGSNIDMGSLPEWAQTAAAENIWYTRTFLAANPEVESKDASSVDLGNMETTPLVIPENIKDAVNNAAAGGSSASASASGAATPTASSAEAEASSADGASGNLSGGSNGASALASSPLLIAVVTLLATVFAL